MSRHHTVESVPSSKITFPTALENRMNRKRQNTQLPREGSQSLGVVNFCLCFAGHRASACAAGSPPRLGRSIVEFSKKSDLTSQGTCALSEANQISVCRCLPFVGSPRLGNVCSLPLPLHLKMRASHGAVTFEPSRFFHDLCAHSHHRGAASFIDVTGCATWKAEVIC